MYILGINAYHGDVSAVLIRDGKLVAALEEERFTRIKHATGFPTEAIRRSLKIGDIDGTKINAVAISRDWRANLTKKAAFVLTNRPGRTLVRDRVRNLRKVHKLEGPLAHALDLKPANLPKIHRVEHHPAHLASAFFVSPFEDAAVCAIDGFGDFVSTSFAKGQGKRLDVFRKVYFPHSLGMFYTAITQYLGFPSFGDEFKVMGLAPYGEPEFVRELSQLVHLEKDGLFKLDLKYFRHATEGVEMEWEQGYPTLGRVFSDKLETLLGPARKKNDPLTQRCENIARSLQAVYEDCAFHVLNALWEQTRSPRLCLAGGCAMNSVANGKVRSRTPFEDVYVQPAAGDNGTALGAAYHVWHQTLGNPRTFVMDHALWGTAYPDANIAALLKQNGINDNDFNVIELQNEDETCRHTAALLAEGKVVGWYQGRMEWGSRALVNRSILADPRRADMRDLINAKIKFREKFRPFAPSVLEEDVGNYFVDPAADPFMQQVYAVREEKRAQLPAITHRDGTGRLQTVNREQNTRYYRLIQEFAKLTGVPVVLNTSFNENERIVDTPEQALDCFLRTKMDALVAGNTVVLRLAARRSPDEVESAAVTPESVEA